MKVPALAAGPDWKQFLSLGERLLAQPDSAAQCDLIVATLHSLLGCEAQVWLAGPLYPLPGEPERPVLPDAPASELVQQVYTTRRPAGLPNDNPQPIELPSGKTVLRAALPLLSHDHLLGVLEAVRPGGPAFRKEEWNYLEGLAAHAAVALETTRQTAIKNWRHEQLALVRSVSSQVANLHDLPRLSQRITRLILESFHYYHVSIFTLEPGRDELLFRASATQGQPAETPVSYTVRLGEGMIGSAAQTGQDQIACDVDQHPNFRFLERLSDTRAEAAIPLIIEEHVLGVLDVQSIRRDAFHENDLLVLHALADAIALAVEGARLYTDLRHQAHQISTVFEVTHALTSILDLDGLLAEVVRAIQKRLGYQYVHLFSVHAGRKKVFYLTGSGARSERMRLLDLAYDLDAPAGLIPHVARSGLTRLANDVSQDPLYLPSQLPPDDTRAELVIPLNFGAEVLGVLDLQSDQINAFREEDLSLLESLAASVAIAYHNATLYGTEQWRRKVGESFRDVASLLSANLPLEELLQTILLALERSLPCDAAAVWLADEFSSEAGEPRLHLAAAYAGGAQPPARDRLEADQVQSWLSAALNQSEAFTRQPEDPPGPLGLALDFPENYSAITAPLRNGDQPLGLLTLVHRTPNRYGSEARNIITTFAGYAAVAIRTARLFHSAQEQAWRSTILLQVAEASQSVSTIDELLSSMVRLTRLLVGIRKCAIFLWDETQAGFELKAWYGLERRPARTRFKEADVPALARLRQTHAAAFIQDAAAELNLPAAAVPPDTGTLVVLPLLARDALLGAFLVAHQATDQAGAAGSTFDDQTLSILQGISHQTAVALENLRLLEARQEEAYVTAVLLQVAQAVVSQNELQDILDTIVHLMPILVGIDAGVFCLWDATAKAYHTAQVYASEHLLEDALSACSYEPGTFRLLDQVRLADAPYYCKVPGDLPAPLSWFDLPCLPIEFMKADSLADHEEWLLGFPLSVKGELLGVLLAKETDGSAASQERRLEILTGIAQQAALAIQNERLKQQMVARERLEREVQVARQIQQTFLPERLPALDGWEVAARWQTSRQVGVDFYDIFRLGRDRLALSIGDVSDKGLPAALYMTVARTLIRAYAGSGRSAAAVLARANAPLIADSPNRMFVTAAYAMLWPEDGRVVYANAGHNRPLLLRPAAQVIEELPKGGLPLGVLSRVQLQDHSLALEPGDCLVLYTDGVTESFSPDGEAFGVERLLATAQECLGLPVEELLNRIDASLVDFRGGAAPSDDLTLLAIRRL